MKSIKISQAIIGWTITYFDGFSGIKDTFTIKEVKWDEQHEVYDVRGDRPYEYLFFKEELLKSLIKQGEIVIHKSIDGCPFRETYRIQKG